MITFPNMCSWSEEQNRTNPKPNFATFIDLSGYFSQIVV